MGRVLRPRPIVAWDATGVEWQDRPGLPGFRRAAPSRLPRTSVFVLNVAASMVARWEEWVREHRPEDAVDAAELRAAAAELRRRSDSAARAWRPVEDEGAELAFEEEWAIHRSGLARHPPLPSAEGW